MGGYDSSRFTPNEVIFDLAPTTARELVVGLRSVVLVDSNGDETSMLSAGHQTLVDSTATHIWLPEDACKSFEVAFDLTYDPIANLYLINDTVHDALLKRNASVVFQLSNSLVAGPAVNITLPYASFDLEVQNTYALVRDTSKYFPLRRARDESQFTLGRVFCQESCVEPLYNAEQVAC